MKVYSETIFSYIEKCEKMLKDILVKETSFDVRRKRFEYAGYLFPIDVIIFEGKSLGYFDANHYQIGLNKSLVFTAKDSVIKDILRHELAHYITYLFHGATDHPHGAEFQEVCGLFKWPKEVSRASMNLDLANSKEGDLASEKTINKVKNLLKLAQSSNPHEAELATLKANKLLLKHNLNYANLSTSNEYVYVKKLLTRKRKDAKLAAVYDILRHFMVRPILSYGKKEVSIEVTGTKTNIELADYVAGFLDEELERLWLKIKKERQLKGVKAKNSFLFGVAKGYDQKMSQVNSSFTPDESKALMVIQQSLDDKVKRIYNRLSSTSSTSQTDRSSYNLGQKAGQSLTINQGVKSASPTRFLE